VHFDEIVCNPAHRPILDHKHIKNSFTEARVKPMQCKCRVLQQKYEQILKTHLISILELQRDAVIVCIHQVLVFDIRQVHLRQVQVERIAVFLLVVFNGW